jgi:hypothetical protein
MKLNSGIVVKESSYYKDHHIQFENDDMYVDGDLVLMDISDIHEAYSYAKSYINNIIVLENIDALSEETIANCIKRHHDVKITNTLIEEYQDVIESNEFVLDPVMLDILEGKSSFINKIEFTLEDGSNIAIDESTYNNLLNLDVDKYKLTVFMRESKENFTSVISQFIE